MNAPARPSLPCTALPELAPGEVLQEEWNTYRRGVAPLLAGGDEGRFVLIKGQHVIGVYDTWDAARVAGLERYAMEPFLVKRILAEEPLLRVRGYNRPCLG
jgi:hypothetical protein